MVIKIAKNSQRENTRYKKEEEREAKRNKKQKIMKFDILPVLDLFIE